MSGLVLNLEYYQRRFRIKKTLREVVGTTVENPGVSIVNGKLFYAVFKGVLIYYPDGTKRFINDSWYE